MTSIALPIEQSVELNLQYPSVSDRYFTYHYYIPNNSGTKVKSNTHANSVEKIKESLKNNQTLDFCPKGEDSLIMMHSNQICVITLSPKHPIFLQEKSITKVDFCCNGIDRLANKVSGKGKKGAQVVGFSSLLCNLECSDGSSYSVFTGIQGKLIEVGLRGECFNMGIQVNERLLEKPNLLSQDPKAEGYLAIVLPKLGRSGKMQNFLFSPQEYEEIYSKYPLT